MKAPIANTVSSELRPGPPPVQAPAVDFNTKAARQFGKQLISAAELKTVASLTKEIVRINALVNSSVVCSGSARMTEMYRLEGEFARALANESPDLERIKSELIAVSAISDRVGYNARVASQARIAELLAPAAGIHKSVHLKLATLLEEESKKLAAEGRTAHWEWGFPTHEKFEASIKNLRISAECKPTEHFGDLVWALVKELS